MIRRRSIGAAMAGLVGLALVAIVAAVVSGVTIDASRWRDTAAQRLSAAVGRPVILQGIVELTLGRAAVLRVGGVRIPNRPGFAAPEFFAADDVRARFDLLDALRGRLNILGVEATDARLWLERGADGRTSWAPAPRSGPGLPLEAIDVGHVLLRGLAIDYHDAGSTTRRSFELDEVSGSARRNEPLRLALRGRADPQVGYAVSVEAGPARLGRDASPQWPFTLDFETPGARLHASGRFDPASGEARFEFDAGAEDLAPLERILDTRLPQLGVAALRGTVVSAPDAVTFTDLRGALGSSNFSGNLALAFGGARTRLSGALGVATLDLRPFAASVQDRHDEPAGIDASTRQSLPLRGLVPVDVDVDLSVDRWIGLPVEVRDARLGLSAGVRGVHMPIRATVAGVPLSGHFELDTDVATPTLAIRFDAKDVALGGEARALMGPTGIEGTLGRVGMRVGGRGETLGALVRDLDLALTVAAARLSYGNVSGGRSIAFTLDSLDVVARPGGRLRGSARGTLLGERAKLAILGGTLPALLREPATPLELDLATAAARLHVEGTLARREATRDTDLTFGFRARRSGDLARWLGVAPESNLPVDLRGRVRIARDAWHLEGATLALGRSELTIDVHRTRYGARPTFEAAVRSPLIDVPELATLRTAATARGKPASRIDVPILPHAVDLADADVGLALERVALGRSDLVGVGLTARIREGRLLPSSVAGRFAGTPFEGTVALDLRGEAPEARLDLTAGRIDVGALLRELGAAEDIDGYAHGLHLALHGRGNTLRELAGHSAFEARVTGGSITVRGAAERPVAEIRVTEAVVGAQAGEPIRVRLDGTLDETAVDIEAASGTLAEFAGDATRLPFSLAANAAGARLALEGEVALPLGRAGRFTFEMSGERLDTLNGLARVELPPWGPWSIRGPIRMTPTGYEWQGLTVRVAQNRLDGTGTLDVTGPRPRLEVRVTAPTLQLDDFRMPQRLTDASPTPPSAADLRATARNVTRQTQRLLSAGFLRRLDATVDVQAQELRSGADRLADGALRVQVEEGRVSLGPAQVNLAGGRMRLSGSFEPTASEVALAARADVENFDYGVLARFLGRGDDIQGRLSLNLDLAGRAPSLETFMHHADGKMDIAVWPADLSGGVVRLWSLNFMLVLLPMLDPVWQSQVNCIVGRFDLEDGKLTEEALLIDTTGVRVRGAGDASLETGQFALVFRPRAKGLALFRLQTPLRVSGTLDDYRIGVERRDMIESILRMIASPILVPLEYLTLGPMPRDGADVCTDPLRTHGRNP